VREIWTLEGFSQCLLRGCRIDESADGGDSIGRQTYASGVFSNGGLVGSEVDTVHLVAGHVAMEPLDFGPISLRTLTDFCEISRN